MVEWCKREKKSENVPLVALYGSGAIWKDTESEQGKLSTGMKRKNLEDVLAN